MAKEVIFTKVRLHRLVQDQVVKVKHFARYVGCPGEREERLFKFGKCCTKGRGEEGSKTPCFSQRSFRVPYSA